MAQVSCHMQNFNDFDKFSLTLQEIVECMSIKRSIRVLLATLMPCLMIVSCLGLEDVAPQSDMIPEFKSLEIADFGPMGVEVIACVEADMASRVAECGFYYTKGESMSVAERVECRMVGDRFSAELDLSGFGERYLVCAYISGIDGLNEIRSDIEKFEINDTTTGFTDLSADGNANCYIVSDPGCYKFSLVKGNGTVQMDSVSTVEVLWESFGTAETPAQGSLVRNVKCEGKEVFFKVPSIYREGNALIAAKDRNGTILWSWHIWLTDEPQHCAYANGSGTMMDRNLGATSATPGDVGALGLLYQWGRKDPFLGSSSISMPADAASTGSWPSPVSSSGSSGTIAYAVRNPMTFITSDSGNYDWHYSDTLIPDDTRWQNQKTIYDPCPAGWRVPDGGEDGIWAKAGFPSGESAQAYDAANGGMLFGADVAGKSTWYPAADYRYGADGLLKGVSCDGYYWSVTPFGTLAYIFYFSNSGYVNPANCYYRSSGRSVRCMKEHSL